MSFVALLGCVLLLLVSFCGFWETFFILFIYLVLRICLGYPDLEEYFVV